MNLYDDLISGKTKLSLVGLGYVGLPIAVAFAKKIKVIGFDINDEKIELFRQGIDPTKEVGDETLNETTVEFTSEATRLREAAFHIIAVPTPVNPDHTPDLRPLLAASHTVGQNLAKGALVVYESTVYPGATEELCIPILEAESGLICGRDFKVGYSPERINPGDKQHRLETITKVVSGCDEDALDTIARVYELVVRAGVYKAESIKTAEAAKVIENCQRDINIAFMNELSIIFHKMGIDTQKVLRAAKTKWNFLNFTPGLVGGHCIGVDPYYLTYKAQQMGYHCEVILSGRRINDSMGKYVAGSLIKGLIHADIPVKEAKVAIFGITFKENCPDIRNTKVMEIVNELKDYGITPLITDPYADHDAVWNEYRIKLVTPERIRNMDALIIAVAHREYEKLTINDINGFYQEDPGRPRILMDVKGIFERGAFEESGYRYWSL